MSRCWPASWPGQPGTSRISVRAWAVSSTTSVTVAVRHVMRAGAAAGAGVAASAANSVAPVALLAPRVAVVVVAGELPEPGLVVDGQRQPAPPLRALPEVQVRDDQARGPAVGRL